MHANKGKTWNLNNSKISQAKIRNRFVIFIDSNTNLVSKSSGTNKVHLKGSTFRVLQLRLDLLLYDIFNIAVYTNSRTKIKLLENCLVDRAQYTIFKANM